jgi:hypothetical protein
MPPMIEAALRLTPGTKARHCQIPITKETYRLENAREFLKERDASLFSIDLNIKKESEI